MHKAAPLRGIVHRDLKPENIVIEEGSSGPTLKLMDFGLAHRVLGNASAAGPIVGTPMYMAPEQAMGRTVDMRADIYSVGLILYELLTGKVPFLKSDLMELLQSQISEKPTAPRVHDPS